MGAVAQGRTNIAPIKIPWELLRTLITEMYGGKVDNEGDFHELSKLVNSFLTPAAYDVDHVLVQGAAAKDGRAAKPGEGGQRLTVPEGSEMKEFIAWVDRLPEREPPTLLGLPANAEKLLLVSHGKTTIENVRRVTEILDESEQLMVEAENAS